MRDSQTPVVILCCVLGALVVAILWSSSPGIHVAPTLIADLAAQKDCCESSVSAAKKARPFPARRQGLTLNQGEAKYGALKAATAGLVEYLCAALDSSPGGDHENEIAQRSQALSGAVDEFSEWARGYIAAQERRLLKNRATGQECCAAASGGSPLPDLVNSCIELLKIAVEENHKTKEGTKKALRLCKLRDWDKL